MSPEREVELRAFFATYCSPGLEVFEALDAARRDIADLEKRVRELEDEAADSGWSEVDP